MLKSNPKFLTSTTFLITRTKSSLTNDALFYTLNNAGVVILNRPKNMNCLTTSMVSKILPKLKHWEKTKSLIITKGAGEKTFCAGGDLKLCIHKEKGPELFSHAQNLIHLISVYSIPYISLNDGYTIGAGLGISLPGKYRIATERTLMAMPENNIGVSAGMGSSYYLPRLKSRIGYYLALTGEVLKGNDTVKVGLATNFVRTERLDDLERNLSTCKNEASVREVLNKICEKSDQFSLTPHIRDIYHCFSAPTLDEIMIRLETTKNEWSIKTLERLHQVCPGSLKITFCALNAGAAMNLKACLMMEYRLACRAVGHHDFQEGVRALLLDKDNKPKWKPQTLSEVSDKYVDSHFEKLPPGIELTLTE